MDGHDEMLLWDRGTVLLSHFFRDAPRAWSANSVGKWDKRTVPMSHKLRIENGELRIVDEILTDFLDYGSSKTMLCNAKQVSIRINPEGIFTAILNFQFSILNSCVSSTTPNRPD